MNTNEEAVIIRPVVRKRPYVDTDKYNKNKIAGAGTVVQPFYGVNGFKTGLEGEQELQTQFEMDLGLVKGTLNPVLSNPFWAEDMNIKLKDEPNVFHRNNPREMLQVLILKNHPIVAPSKAEITPDTQFYLEDTVIENERKLAKSEKKEKAYGFYSNQSPEEKRKFLKLFNSGGGKDMDDTSIKTMLGELLEKDVDDFLGKASYSKEKINLQAFIYDLVSYGVLRLNSNRYFDNGEDMGNLDTLTSTLLAPNKADLYHAYKERLEQKKLSS